MAFGFCEAPAIYGLVLLGFMYTIPQGLAGLARLIGERIRRR